jgi:hypothetical protein
VFIQVDIFTVKSRISDCFMRMHVTCPCSLSMPSINKWHGGQENVCCAIQNCAETRNTFWLMHNTDFSPQRIAIMYAASRGQDVLLAYTLYQNSPGFDSQLQVLFYPFLGLVLNPRVTRHELLKLGVYIFFSSLWNKVASRRQVQNIESVVCKSIGVRRK